jgi:hypothetical protein
MQIGDFFTSPGFLILIAALFVGIRLVVPVFFPGAARFIPGAS